MQNEDKIREYFMKSERLCFSRWAEDDLDLARALWMNPEVARLIHRDGAFSEEEVRGRLEAERRTQQDFGFQYWPLFLRYGGDFVGCCGLRPGPNRTDIAELGIHLLPEYWGRGYGFEACRAALEAAGRVPGLHSVFAGHHPENLGSRRLLYRLGFSLIGEQYYPPTGLNHPTYLYTLP